MRSWFRRISYPVLCALLGVALGWVPAMFHGPIPYKFNVLGIRGAVAVRGFYVAMFTVIGTLVAGIAPALTGKHHL